MAGGGVALLRAKQAITDLKGDTPDQNAGIKLILRAVEEPLRTIVANAGEEASVVVNNVLNGKGYGYNAATADFNEPPRSHQGDPALQNAAASRLPSFVAEAAATGRRQPAAFAAPWLAASR